MNHYYVIMSEETRGPYTEKQLQAMWLTGALTSQTPVMINGDSEWDTLSSYMDILELEKKPVPAIPFKTQQSTAPQKVDVNDIDMKFWSMVVFMIKWAFASIPAVIVLMFVGFAIAFTFVLIAAALGASFPR
jgi:hypothetical protein